MLLVLADGLTTQCSARSAQMRLDDGSASILVDTLTGHCGYLADWFEARDLGRSVGRSENLPALSQLQG